MPSVSKAHEMAQGSWIVDETGEYTYSPPKRRNSEKRDSAGNVVDEFAGTLLTSHFAEIHSRL